MIGYILRRLALIPLTLFAILLVNFAIINLAPGEPSTLMEMGGSGEGRSSDNQTSGTDRDPYRLVRMRYGLCLPILFNRWLFESRSQVQANIEKLILLESRAAKQRGIGEQLQANQWRQSLLDRAPFQMVALLKVASDPTLDPKERQIASQLMAKGAQRLAITSLRPPAHERQLNQQINHENQITAQWILQNDASDELKLHSWRELIHKRTDLSRYASMSRAAKVAQGFIQTRFIQYFNRVLRLDFGTLRSDSNRLVTHEVLARLPISLFLSIIPLILSFLLSLPLGLLMASFHRQALDPILNTLLLAFYAAPVFVVAPLLIECFAGNMTLPWSHVPLPTSGFHSLKRDYDLMTSAQKLGDILHHIFLPMIAVSYSTLAAKARLARSSVLEVLHQDYILNARARGLSRLSILFKHVLKNASITLVTAIAGSLGAILGGSLIVETLFDINGFGKFFYEAIIKRDINVIMFSTLLGSFLTLISYLIADIAYTLLDPRVQLD